MTRTIEDNASTAQIRGAIDRWSRAMAEKDASGVNACLTADCAVASMAPPLRTIGPDAAGMQAWLDTWRGPIGYEITDLAITAAENVAFSHSLNRLSGTKVGGEVVELWFRHTLGLRKIGGDWMIAHAHESVPFYMDGSVKAAVDLKPTGPQPAPFDPSPMETILTEPDERDPLQRGVIPHLSVEGAGEASAFYQRAFGAREITRMPAQDGKRLMHCHLELNGGPLMLADAFPEQGHGHQPSHSVTMTLVVGDIDAWFNRAVDAGATVTMPVQRMFWGDRYGQLRDPFGVGWAINEPSARAEGEV
jgi:PhnB protein